MSDLTHLFRPKSVALIGASSDTKKYGYWTAKSLIDNKFTGELYLISRNDRDRYSGSQTVCLSGGRARPGRPGPL